MNTWNRTTQLLSSMEENHVECTTVTTSANNVMQPSERWLKAEGEIMLLTKTIPVPLQDNHSHYCCWNKLIVGTVGCGLKTSCP